MVPVTAGNFVITPHGPGQVLHLAQYKTLPGEHETEATAAVVVFASKRANIYLFDKLQRISEVDYLELTRKAQKTAVGTAEAIPDDSAVSGCSPLVSIGSPS